METDSPLLPEHRLLPDIYELLYGLLINKNSMRYITVVISYYLCTLINLQSISFLFDFLKNQRKTGKANRFLKSSPSPPELTYLSIFWHRPFWRPHARFGGIQRHRRQGWHWRNVQDGVAEKWLHICSDLFMKKIKGHQGPEKTSRSRWPLCWATHRLGATREENCATQPKHGGWGGCGSWAATLEHLSTHGWLGLTSVTLFQSLSPTFSPVTVLTLKVNMRDCWQKAQIHLPRVPSPFSSLMLFFCESYQVGRDRKVWKSESLVWP